MNNHIKLYLVEGKDRISLNDPRESTYLVAGIDGLAGLPPIRTSSGVNVGMDGGWTSAQFFDARLITIKGVIANNDVAIVEQKRRELNAMLARKKLQLSFTTEAGNTYSMDVRVMECTMPMETMLTAQNFSINFRADDPLLYSGDSTGTSQATLLVKKPDDGFTIPFNIPFIIPGGAADLNVKNEGTSDVSTVIKLVGPLHSPTVVNKTTQQQMGILKDLTADDEVIIDSKMKTITMNGVDIYDAKTPESTFVEIAQGNNYMYLTSETASDKGRAEIYFKAGYYSL